MTDIITSTMDEYFIPLIETFIQEIDKVEQLFDESVKTQEYQMFFFQILSYQGHYYTLINNLVQLNNYINQFQNDAFNHIKSNLFTPKDKSRQQSRSSKRVIEGNVLEFFKSSEAFNNWEFLRKRMLQLDGKNQEIHKFIEKKIGNEGKRIKELLLDNFSSLEKNILDNDRPKMEDLEKAATIILSYIHNDKLLNSFNNANNTLLSKFGLQNNSNIQMVGLDPLPLKIESLNLRQISEQNTEYVELKKVIESDWKEFNNNVIRQLNSYYNLYEIEKELLETLKQFDPDFQVFLPRLAEILEEEQNITENALKFTLIKYPELGVYNSMAQVFKPADTISKQLDDLLAKFDDLEGERRKL